MYHTEIHHHHVAIRTHHHHFVGVNHEHEVYLTDHHHSSQLFHIGICLFFFFIYILDLFYLLIFYLYFPSFPLSLLQYLFSYFSDVFLFSPLPSPLFLF